ncbi:MAG: TonB-dependent receptor [Bacteroidetes bacterium]|nr:TonB-dependent receptor [Bacteroidota bacterium]
MTNSKTYFSAALMFMLLGLNCNTVLGQKNNVDTIQLQFLSDTSLLMIDEVVITGTRVSKKIIDIPYSVIRLNYTNYLYDKKIGIDDVLTSVPGMFLQSRYGNHDVRVSIRGFGSKSNSGIRGVRILLDDIPESEPDGQTRIEAIDFQSIGRIEIAKGNLSSMYTNAPGGVINFINDIDFLRTHAVQFNQFGSFGLRRNGIKIGIRTDDYGLLTTYSNHNYDGYRAHNSEKWNIVNTVVETRPSENSSLKLLLYYADGIIKLPGSLTKEEFEEDPYQADQRAIDRDMKRISAKGRLGVRFNTKFGQKLNNEFELTAYGTIKYFERTSREYRIINRYGLGVRANYLNKSKILNRANEFSIGTDLLFQPAKTEYYDNINGQKGDQLLQLQNEKINNTGYYISNNYEIIRNRFFMLLTGRYDHIIFKLQEETLPSRTDSRTFDAFMPKCAFNYKLTPDIALYTSYSLSFDSPAKNELESFDPAELYNHDLKAQKTKSFELGLKGNIINRQADFFNRLYFEVTFFNMNIDHEVVPFEVYNEVFFRNAAKTNRRGVELGSRIEIVKSLDFTFSYTFSDFIYNSYEALVIEIDTTGNIIEKEQDFSGHIVPSIPRNNLFMSLSYSHPIVNQVNAFLKLSYSGISGLWVDDANSDKTKSYQLINSVLGVDMKFGKVNVLISGGMNNMLDEVYVGFTNTNSADRRFYEAGEPGNFFCSINLGYTF